MCLECNPKKRKHTYTKSVTNWYIFGVWYDVISCLLEWSPSPVLMTSTIMKCAEELSKGTDCITLKAGPQASNCAAVESSWNLMARGDARKGKWRGNWRMEWVASTLHTTSEHGVSSITNADAHTSGASSRMNWRPRRYQRTRPFRRTTKSGFCTCANTFKMQSTYLLVRYVYESKVPEYFIMPCLYLVTGWFYGFTWQIYENVLALCRVIEHDYSTEGSMLPVKAGNPVMLQKWEWFLYSIN
jgi:hypothetical protein